MSDTSTNYPYNCVMEQWAASAIWVKTGNKFTQKLAALISRTLHLATPALRPRGQRALPGARAIIDKVKSAAYQSSSLEIKLGPLICPWQKLTHLVSKDPVNG